MPETKVTKLFDEREIAFRVEGLARMAVERLPRNFAIVGLLVGSFVFVADFIRVPLSNWLHSERQVHKA